MEEPSGAEKSLKIIIVNYRYFISGGPERYLFNIKELLEKNGHIVIPFSVKSSHNEPSAYEGYFLEPIGEGKEVYFKDYNKSDVKTVVKSLSRMFYSFEAKKKLKQLIKDVEPDLIYILHYQNKMSASVIDAGYESHVPVIQRISDFGHICSNNVFYLFNENRSCEKCLHGSRFNAVQNKCVQNSYLLSFVKVLSLSLQDVLKIRNKIAAFIIPSKFTASKFIEFGVAKDKIYNIPTFFNGEDESDFAIEYNNYALYVGRVEQEKGVMTLVKAFENSERKLIIIGASSGGYDVTLKEYLAGKKHNIEFAGHCNFTAIKQYLSKCLFTICPSECYDNFPNTVLESFAFKKAVVASRLGSLVEMIDDRENGLLFEVGNPADLREKVEFIFEHKELAISMGEEASQKIADEYSAEQHYYKLLSVFNSLLHENNKLYHSKAGRI